MNAGRYLLGRLAWAASLLLGVTALCFVLMVQYGPDQAYHLLGRNASAEQLAELRAELGHDRPLPMRYAAFLRDLGRLELGRSNASGEPVGALIARTLPVTLLLVLPPFVLANLLGIALGMAAAWWRDRWPDRLVSAAAVAGMSLSFLVILIVLQVLLCTPWGLDLLPARGWDVHDAGSWLRYATAPGLALVLVTLGYNVKFFRAVFVEELARDHVRTARAFGASPAGILGRSVLRNALPPLLTRVLFSVPLVVVSGSLLLETQFGIPGLGRSTFDAISSGDQPVLVAVVALTAVAFVAVQLLAELLLRLADPRISAP